MALITMDLDINIKAADVIFLSTSIRSIDEFNRYACSANDFSLTSTLTGEGCAPAKKMTVVMRHNRYKALLLVAKSKPLNYSFN